MASRDTLQPFLNNDTLPAPIVAPPLKHSTGTQPLNSRAPSGRWPGAAPTLFTHHKLKTVSPGPESFHPYQPDWVFGILVSCFVILAWVTLFYRKRFLQVLYGTFSKRYLGQVVREGNLIKERIAVAPWGGIPPYFLHGPLPGSRMVYALEFW